jgi:hypothetical protein
LLLIISLNKHIRDFGDCKQAFDGPN